MMKTLITLIALTAMQLVHAQVPSGVPWATANGKITQPGILAVTCGVLAAVPVAEQYTFGLKDVRAANLAPMPTNNMDYSKIWYPPVYHHPDWTLSRIGNVFGICFDTDGDIYVSASSSYNDSYFAEAGLVRYGEIGGGANSLLAAGTVYKIDKTTGIPTVFCQLPQQATVLRYSSPLSEGSVRVTGPGLGDICYDAERNQFFVSNFEDGKIYRISATGAILDSYDPFVADNGAVGAAPENERVWALQVSAGRLYFSTWRSNPASGPSALYSVPMSALGTPSGTVDLFHVSVGTTGPDGETPKMSDIAFNAQGDLLVAERTMGDLIASYNHESRVYHFKKTGSSWITSTISPGHNFHEGYGGADWGYDGTTKEGFIWASSADLLDEPGPHGVQGWRIADTPVNGQLPYSKSVMVPFMPASQNPEELDVKGFGGDLEIYDEPCISIADGAVTICAGTTTNLTTSITGYANLLSPVWTVATAGGTSVTTPTAVMPSVTTTYVLVAQNAAGCQDTAKVVVTVNPKPNAGPDQTLACTNNALPTSFDLVDAAVGQKWKIISPVPAGASISVTTPAGAVTGTIVAGVYKFRLQTQSDSVNCADTVQVTIQSCTTLGTLGDYVWKDTNNNGIQDEPASAGVKDVVLELYKNGTATGIKDTTDATGKYLFSISDSASYQVKIVSGLPAGCAISTKQNASGSTDANDSDFNPTSGLSDAVTVNPLNPAKKDVLTVDAALYSPKGSLGDYVWKDTNDNGIQDEPASAGVSGVILELYKNGTATGIKDTTDATGKYLFSISDSASYQVKIVSGLPAGYVISTKQNASGSTDANDSDFNPTSGLSDAVTVNPLNPAKRDVLTVDVGLNCNVPVITATQYTPATCPTTGVTPNNNASLKITANGDKAAISSTGTPTTTYAAATAISAGSVTFNSLNGGADSLFVRIFNGNGCVKDTILVVKPVVCCPVITFGTPANFTQYCSEATIATLTTTTTARSPDSLAFYISSTKLTTYNDIVGAQPLGKVRISGTSTSNNVSLSNVKLPELIGTAIDTLYIYSVYMDDLGDTTCKVFAEKPIILKPEPTASIDGFTTACNSVAVTLTSEVATTYKWGRVGGTTTLATTQTLTQTPPINATTTYWLITTNAGACSSDTAYHSITTSSGILGTVYRDFDSDGIKDAGEKYGVKDIEVKAYDCDGKLLGTTTTDEFGRYSFSTLTAAAGKVRIEFSTSTLPAFYQESFAGTNNGTNVQFVTAPNCNVDWAVKETGDYCQTNPKLVTPCYLDGAVTPNTTAVNDVLVSVNYDLTGKTVEATRTEIGSTWGIGYAKTTKKLYSAAFLKRHVGLKDGKLGQIYVSDFATAGTPTTPWLDVSTLPGIAGTWQYLTDAQRGLGNAGVPSRDSLAFSQIAAIGLGDIDVSEDEKQLYAMDLTNKQLLVIDIATKTLVGKYPVPSVCSATATPSYYSAYPQTFTATDGKLWKNGYYFNTDNGGLLYNQTITNPNSATAGTTDAALYTRSIFNTTVLNYQFPLGNGTYSVKFHTITNGVTNASNFNILAEGATVFSNVNVYAEAGNAINKGITKTFTATVTDGVLNIRLVNNAAGTAIIASGFEITPTSGQASGQTRPFAIKPYKGKVYVGAVCDAGYSQNRSDMKAGVLEFNPATGAYGATPTLTFTLDYPKGSNANFCNDSWEPWTSVYPNNTANGINCGGFFDFYAQPVLSDIEFDQDGSMILGFFDRMGHQMGAIANFTPDGRASSNGAIGGDILRAYFNGTAFELENNAKEGISSAKSATAGRNNNQGPGGGEFYYGDFTSSSSVQGHFELGMGGLAYKPGADDIRLTAGDPLAYSTGGLLSLDNRTGAKLTAKSITLYTGFAGGLQNKASGLGDLEILCDPAPIQIGNYIWVDTDKDGIQDPCELPAVDVKVYLYTKAGVLKDSTTTNATGNWYFSSPTDSIKTNTAYYIVFGGANQYNKNTGILKVGTQNYNLTAANVGEGTNKDQNDSDAQTTLGGLPVALQGFPIICDTTGGPGYVNHTLDVGLQCNVPVITATQYTPATCPTTGVTPNNNASIIITANGDKASISSTGTPTTTYAAATAISAGSVTFSSLNGGADSLFVRIFNGDGCVKDTILVVKPVVCCPTMSFGTPANFTAYCSEATVATLTATTNAQSPDSVAFYISPAKLTTYNDIVGSQLLGKVRITGTAAANNSASLTNAKLPELIGIANDTLYIYSVYVDDLGDTTCKVFAEKPIILKPEPKALIDGFTTACNSVAVTLTSEAATTYKWGRVSPAASNLGTAQTLTVTPPVNATTTYWLITTNAGACSSDTAYHSITTSSGILGTVYRDFDSDGIKDAGEKYGLKDIEVKAYDCDGKLLGTTTTDEFGRYSFSTLTAASGKVRIEFSKTSMPSWLQESFAGTGNGTNVQFVTAPNCNVDLAMKETGDYCQNDPKVAIPCYVNGAAINGTVANQNTIVQIPYSANSTTAGSLNTYLAQSTETGSVYGMAYKKDTKKLFMSAFLKRHTGLLDNDNDSNGDLGAIYQLDAATNTVTLFTTVPNAGTIGNDATRGLGAFTGTSRDPMAFSKVGKEGLGDMDISEEGQYLYVVNLFTKELVRIDIATKAQTTYPIPTDGCTNGVRRPFGLGIRNGKVYIGTVCTAENSGAIANMEATVYAFDGSTFTPVLDFPLNYPKGYALNTGPTTSWLPWTDNVNTFFNSNSSCCFTPNGEIFTYNQPILSDIDFDEKGQMLLGFMDRGGHQAGWLNLDPGTSTRLWGYTTGGDLLTAYPNSSANTWTLESRGDKDGAGSYTPIAGQINNQGPGGGEFYYNENWTASHQETAQGGLTTLLGSASIMTTLMDHSSILQGGVRVFSNENGSTVTGYPIFVSSLNSNIGTFGKAAGLGDAELLCDPAPIQIGNYIWLDADADGVQDPCELPAVDVKVYLYTKAGVLKDSTTTNATGNWYFSSPTDSIKTNTAYFVVVGGASQFNKTTGVITVGGKQYQLTSANTGQGPNADQNDSDALTSGVANVPANLQGFPVICDTTGGSGYVNHSLDIGLTVPAGSLGDFVWKDTNNNGKQEAGETGVKGVVIELYKNGTFFAKDTTDAFGKYGFFNLDSASYYIKVVANSFPAGCVISQNPNAATVADSLDSDIIPATLQSQTVIIDPTPIVGASLKDNPTLDVALFSLNGSLGDYVWKDTNDNGIQDETGTGVSGVILELYKNGTATGIKDTTDATGKYLFSISDSASYQVKIVSGLPAGCTISTKQNAAGSTDANDSDFNPTSGLSDAVTVNPSNPARKDVLTVDAALYSPKGSLGDFVWKDTNNNGIQDETTASNGGVAGVQIELYKVGTATAIAKDTTDATGKYLFTNLDAGQYYIKVLAASIPVGCTISMMKDVSTGDGTEANDSDVDSATGQSGNYTIDPLDSAKKDILTVDAALYSPKGSLGDYVWKDTNDNGIQDETGTGVSGVILELYKNGTATGIKDTTDATGKYLFSISDSASYQVKIVSGLPAGCTISTKQNAAGSTDANDSDFNPTSGLSDAVTVNPWNPARKDVLTVDAALYSPKGSLGDYVWKDTNDNGIQDETGTGVSGVILELYKNGTATGIKDTTDATGKYLFSISDSASYQVKIVSGLPAGCTISTKQNAAGSTDANDSDFNPTSGLSDAVTVNPSNPARKDVLTVDAALYSPKGSLGDFVWKDTNNNGIQDETTANNGGVTGVQIELYKVGTASAIAKDTTDATGKYLFTNLDAGQYYIKVLAASIPVGCTISTMKDVSTGGGTEANDSDVDPATGQSGNYTIDLLDPLKKDILTVDAALIALCPKPTLTINSAPACSSDKQTYSITFSITGKNGILKANGIALIGNSPYEITLPSGTNLTITDSLSALCKHDTTILAPSCGCPVSAPVAVAPSVVACQGEGIPMLSVTVPAGTTANWYASQTSTTALSSSSLTFTPTTAGTYWVEAVVIGPQGCVSTTRTPITLSVVSTACVPVTVKKRKK